MTDGWCNKLPEYALVVETPQRRVVMDEGLAKDYRRIAPKDKGSLRKWLEIWCDDVDGVIPDTRLKAQERYAGKQGQSILILAFKSYQARLYGFIQQAEGKETFFITAIDPKKKDDNANPRILKRAAGEAFSVMQALA